jgi:predicted PurR-regulated permease PerM
MRLSDNIGFDNIDKVALFRIITVSAVIVGILMGCLMVLAPFIPAILLGIIFCLAGWPSFVWMEQKLKHRTTLAASLMTGLLAICFLAPLILMANSLTDNFSKLYGTIIRTLQTNDGVAPEWISELPWVNEYAMSFWQKYLADTKTMSQALTANAGMISQKLIKVAGMIGRGVVDISLGILIAFFLFRHGVQVAERLQALIDKFLGENGQRLMNVSKDTIVSVVYGVLGTAAAQGSLAAIGFAIAGVPGAVFLGLLIFFVSFVPMGPPLIWIPVTAWLFSQGEIGMGIFMALWGLVVISGIDNIIRPYFIYLGSNLPILLVLLGVLGGILAFGFIGVFIGPTLLALAYTLVLTWSTKPVPMKTLSSSYDHTDV